MPDPSMLDAALAYATEFGWAVFPLKPGDKIPLGGRGCLDATTDPERIGAWWDASPTANIGLATGEPSGLVVVDIDGEAGEAALAAYGTMPLTPVSLTGKGRHLLFARPVGGLRNSAGKLGPQLDVRGDGGYIVVPPSRHPSGHRYRWDRDHGGHPADVGLAPVPDAILARLTAPAAVIAPAGDLFVTGPRAADIPAMQVVPNGTRNATLASYAGRLLAKGHGELETLELVRALNSTKCAPPLDGDEVERIVLSIATAERRQVRPHAPVADVPAPADSVPPLVRIDQRVTTALAWRNEQPIDATPTMLRDWNDACRGFGGGVGLARGWHVTVGGASGTGKSLFALNLVASALRAGVKCAYVSLEMSADQLISRLLAILCDRPVRELEPGFLYSASSFAQSSRDLSALCEETGADLFIAERPKNDIPSVAAQLARAADDGCRLLVVDYVQLLHAPGADGVYEHTRRASAAIQRVAFARDVVTVGLSQFNRATSFAKDTPPTAHGLTGASALENDSDQVLLIDHSATVRNGALVDTNIMLAKNRHGPVPTIPVRWNYKTLRLEQRVVAR